MTMLALDIRVTTDRDRAYIFARSPKGELWMAENLSIKDLERFGAEVGVSINKEFINEVKQLMKDAGLDIQE